jgi:hypothetical protein
MWQASEGLIAILAAVFAFAMFSKPSRRSSETGSGRETAGVAANISNSSQRGSAMIENAALGPTAPKDFAGEANRILTARNLD